MLCSHTSKPDLNAPSAPKKLHLILLVWMAFGAGLTGWSQETDFSPFARFGLGTAQGNLAPNVAGIGGISSISTTNLAFNADQPASASGLLQPTFQGSVVVQQIQLEEGDKMSNAVTGGPGNFGLVVKRPRSQSALQLGLTPLSSKAFSIARTLTDSTLGEIKETYDGSGGLARAHLGYARGWRGRSWVDAGGTDSVLINRQGLDVGVQLDHWFGDAIQSSTTDILDLSHRDVQTVLSSRHRATGVVLGAEGYRVMRARYDETRQFRGSWMVRLGGTWSPARTLNTDFTRLRQSTLVLNGTITPIDTSAFEQEILLGEVPQKWTLGGGIQWDGGRGHRLGLFVDHHRQAWSQSAEQLSHLMDGSAQWGDGKSTAFGVLWIPGRKSGKVSRATYRAGWCQTTLPVVLQGDDMTLHPLEEWRASLGVNAPLKGSRSSSQIHLGMDFGRRSSELPNTHQETNLRFHVGVTLTPFAKNLWLTPRLYD